MPGASRPLISRPDAFENDALEDDALEARDFHFAVTWATLFAHLDPVESRGLRRHVLAPPQRVLAPAAPAPIAPHRPRPDSGASWEMVVPRMIRTGDGSFAPAEGEKGA